MDDAKVTLWINQGGDRWSTPIEIKGTPRVSDIAAVRLIDLYSSGISGVLWSVGDNGQSRMNLFLLEFTGGVKLYLPKEMADHMGAITRVGYASWTQFYLEDKQRPETRWKTPLPFPVQVVARVEVIYAISGGKLTSEYRLWRARGSTARARPGGAPAQLLPASPGPKRTTQWERAADCMTQFSFTADYDAYGQPGSQIASAVPRGRDFRVAASAGEPYLATHTMTTYAYHDDAQRYLISRVARTTSYEILNDGSPTVFALQR